jgi:hypothetical protein
VEQVTTQNLTVVDVDAEKNLLLVKGAVPGTARASSSSGPSVKVSLRAQHAEEVTGRKRLDAGIARPSNDDHRAFGQQLDG